MLTIYKQVLFCVGSSWLLWIIGIFIIKRVFDKSKGEINPVELSFLRKQYYLGASFMIAGIFPLLALAVRILFVA